MEISKRCRGVLTCGSAVEVYLWVICILVVFKATGVEIML